MAVLVASNTAIAAQISARGGNGLTVRLSGYTRSRDLEKFTR